MPAGQQVSLPPSASCRTSRIKILHAIGSRQRAQFGFLVERIANFQALHLGDELALELVGDGLGHDEALGGNAGLAIVLTCAPSPPCDGRVQIGAGHHNKRIAAAQFKHDFLDPLGRANANLNPRLFTARQSRGHDARIVQDRVHLSGADQQRLKRTFGKSGFQENAFNRQRALRHVGGMLQQSNIARHQRRRRETEHLPERKIPRHHREYRDRAADNE